MCPDLFISTSRSHRRVSPPGLPLCQRLWRMSSSRVLSVSRLLIVSGQQILRILLRQVLLNAWILFMVDLHVSARYNRKGFTTELCFRANLRKSCSCLDNPHFHVSICPSTSSASPSSVMGLRLSVLILRTLLFPL